MPPGLLGRYHGPSRVLDPRRWVGASAYIRRLRREFLRGGIDLVHATSLRACVLGGLAARWAGIPNIWHLHSVVAEPMISRSGVRLLRNLARRVPDHIICNSAATAACLDVPASKISVVPVGVDGTRFQPNGPRTTATQRVGLVARIAPLKGQHVFIDAAERLSQRVQDLEFVVAGTPLFSEGDYDRQVREQAVRSPHGERIKFVGFVDDVPALLHDLDVLVHTSVLSEGFGQSIVEGMLAGKPVVASAVGGPLEIIEEGVTGRLVPPGDSGALADAVEDLLRDPAAASAMGQRAREIALERFNPRRCAREIERVYEQVLSRRSVAA
jgi:glycosyltransferase involved in cell wall biosynthesis